MTTCTCGHRTTEKEKEEEMNMTTCTCGCGATIGPTCDCGCDCCAPVAKTRQEEVEELKQIRDATDRRLAELEAR